MKLPEIEISIRYKKNVKYSELTKIETSRDCADLFRLIANQDTILWTEEFLMICLSRANKVINWYKVSQGGVSGTVADPKVIFTIALQSAASSIIICHNHPSGNLTPSRADEELTHKIVNAGKLLDINVLDHIILTEESYLSFADEGLI